MKEPKFQIPYSEIARKLDGKDLKQSLNFILMNIHRCKLDECLFSFVFRKLRPILNLNLVESIVDPGTFKSFSIIIQSVEIPYDKFLDHLSEHAITELFESIEFLQERQKDAVISVLESITNRFRESAGLFLDIMANIFVNIKFDTHSITDLPSFFRILHLIISKDCADQKMADYYTQFVLPVILDCPVATFEPAHKLVDAFCSSHPGCQKATLKYFLENYNKFSGMKQAKIIEMTARIVHISFFIRPSSPLLWEFCSVVNLGLKSENFIVIDSVIDIFNDNAVKRFISDNHKMILPLIFENLYRLSKRFWKQEQRCRAIQTLGGILNQDNELFENCLVEYNMKKSYRCDPDPTLDDEKYCLDRIKQSRDKLR